MLHVTESTKRNQRNAETSVQVEIARPMLFVAGVHEKRTSAQQPSPPRGVVRKGNAPRAALPRAGERPTVVRQRKCQPGGRLCCSGVW